MSERRVLLVEDNDEHAELVEFVLSKTHPDAALVRKADGQSALDHLRACTPDTCPHLTLLDLKLPGISGIELLQQLRTEARCEDLTVVLFTTSNSDRDRADALRAHANAFIVKPMDFSQLKERLEATFRFWLDHAVE